VLILPYLEQNTVYDQWDLSDQYYAQNDTARQTRVNVYYCPSRRKADGLSTAGDVPDNSSPDSNHHPDSLSDYAGCAGDFNYSSWYDGVNANGAIRTGTVTVWQSGKVQQYQGYVPLAAITDGTSNTLLIGEKQVLPSKFGIGVGDGSIFNGDHEWNFARVAGPGYALCRDLNDTTSWNARFGSSHAAVVNFVLCDGSIRSLATTTNTTVLHQLIVRNDGEVVAP
jgi:hypothetical protein